MKNQQEIVEDIYREYYHQFVGLAKRIVHNEEIAKEIVQEAFVTWLAEGDKMYEHTNLPGWLYRIVCHKALNERRRQKQHKEVPLEEAQSIAEERDMISFEDSLPEGLQPAERQLLIGRYVEQLSYDELAVRFGKNSTAVRVQLHRIQRRYVELMRQDATEMDGKPKQDAKRGRIHKKPD